MHQKQLTHNDLPQAVGLLLSKVEMLESILTTKDATGQAPQSDIIKTDEAARYLGMTKRAVYARTCKGELPHIKLNNSTHIRFSRKALHAWLMAGHREAA